MSRRTPVAFLLVICSLLLAIALGACGDDSLSAEQLRARATAICTRTAAATDRIAVPARPSEGGAFLAEGIAQLRVAARRLAALKAPEDLRERYDRAVELAGEEVALIARHERAIASGDDVIDTFRRLDDELEPLTVQEDAYWRALEIPRCVRR
ncbi:MAG TPA: hypothetical protein VK506_00345 [Conexibacter sp.]|nr:hypothetical protein [Conexibacter sp.]